MTDTPPVIEKVCAWCEDYGDGMDPEPCPKHSHEPPEPTKPRWLPGEWPEMRDN